MADRIPPPVEILVLCHKMSSGDLQYHANLASGVDIEQTEYYIKLLIAVYICKILKNHPWINNEKPAGDFPILMKSDNVYIRALETAEPFMEKDRTEYEEQLGFSYCQGIGEIIYALITC